MGVANLIGVRLAAFPADVAPDALDTIVERVSAICPRPAHPLEVTAVLESLGYTDAVIREITPHPDSRSLGELLFEGLRASGVEPPAEPRPAHDSREDVRVLFQTFSLSSIYALPWIVTHVLQRWNPEMLQVPQDAAAPLALALIFSLIVSGGFVQCIARKGSFYTGLGQHALGAQVGARIWQCGVGVLALTALGAVAVSWYFDIFQARYAALGAAWYLLLGALWLTCGFLWVERRYWHVPVTFGGAALAFMAVRTAGGSSLEAQLAAGAAALTIALGLMALALHRHRPGSTRRLALPRFAVLSRALAPYFCYGIGYFAFVFADRIAAGTAVPTASGMQFSVDAHYQAGMDTALMCFLISMAAVEFLNYRFIHFWQREAAAWQLESGGAFRDRVREHCARSWLLVAVSFGVTVLLVLSLLPSARETMRDPLAARVLVFGLAGYLLLELALFNALVLFSVNAPVPVLRALLAGFAVNAAGGYLLSHAFGPVFAACAMCVGAAVFLRGSDRALGTALDRPGYGCYVA
jgi:hypothetical protein